MTTVKLPDEHWLKIVAFLRDCPWAYVGNPVECRRFVEGVLLVTRSGGQWRLLPAEYGKWNTVYKLFARWCDHDVWEQMHQHFADDPEMENLIIDSTVVRAHPSAAGAACAVRHATPCSPLPSRPPAWGWRLVLWSASFGA